MSGPRAYSWLTTVNRGKSFTDCSSTGTDRHGTARRTPVPNTSTTLPLPPQEASGVRDLPFLRVIPALANRLSSKLAREFCSLQLTPPAQRRRCCSVRRVARVPPRWEKTSVNRATLPTQGG